MSKITTQVTIFHLDGSQQIIRPQFGSSSKSKKGQATEPFFNGDWQGLVEAITGSDLKRGHKNYLSFDVS